MNDHLVNVYDLFKKKHNQDFIAKHVFPQCMPTWLTLSCVFYCVHCVNNINKGDIGKYEPIHAENYKEYCSMVKSLIECVKCDETDPIGCDPMFMFNCVKHLLSENHKDLINDDCMKSFVDLSQIDFNCDAFKQKFEGFDCFLKNKNTFCFLLFVYDFFELLANQCEQKFRELKMFRWFSEIKQTSTWSRWKQLYKESLDQFKSAISQITTEVLMDDTIGSRNMFQYINEYSTHIYPIIHFVFLVHEVIDKCDSNQTSI